MACVRMLLSGMGRDPAAAMCYLRGRLTANGVSVADIVMALTCSGVAAAAYRLAVPPHQGPYIMYDRRRRHFILVESWGPLVRLYDPGRGRMAIMAGLFRLAWPHYCIVIEP